ncbi:MAG: hypothetical protein ACE5I3_14310, partial [Phycisphaerae bacterium]
CSSGRGAALQNSWPLRSGHATPPAKPANVRHTAALLAVLALVALGGCGGKRATIADTFPKGSYASPWVLQDEVWSGSFDQAAGALGEEAEQWRAFEPERVWLAVYRHDTHAEEKLTVRAFAFWSNEQARRAFEHFRPPDADELKAGSAGCWTPDGVLVLWGRVVFDLFGHEPSAFASPEQAVYLLAFIEKKMPRGLPDAPQ